MKRLAPNSLITFSQANPNCLKADLFAITLPTGAVIYTTEGQWDITVPTGTGGMPAGWTTQTFSANQYGRWFRGDITSELQFDLATNTMDLTCEPTQNITYPNTTLGILSAARNGLFDAAGITVYTAYMPLSPTWNLIKWSQNMSEASWVLNNTGASNPVITANATPAPDGTMTGSEIAFPSVGSGDLSASSENAIPLNPNGTTATFSVWMQSASGTVSIRLKLTSKTTGNGTSTFFNVTPTWQRFNITSTWPTSDGGTEVQAIIENSGANGALPAATIYAWGAQVNIGNAVFPYQMTTATAGITASGYGNVSAGIETKWMGTLTEISEITRTKVVFKCNDPLCVCDTKIPRRLYQANCPLNFCDTNCTLNAANYTISFTAANTSTQNVLVPTVAFTTIGAGCVDGYFTQGVVVCTSGQNNGLSKSVTLHADGQLTVDSPWLLPVAAGDTYSVIGGCDKTLTTCHKRPTVNGTAVDNSSHFMGMPFMPPPSSVTG